MRGIVVLTGPGAHLLAFRARRPGEQFLEVGEFIADEGLAPGVPREQRLAEPRIGLQQG